MCEVYMVAGSVRQLFMTFNSQEEAYKFCNDNGWEWLDGNDFLWSLEMAEAPLSKGDKKNEQ